jgi:methyltransferase, FkbM family
MRRKVVVDLVVFGERLKVRTASPDIYVAMETLGGEFGVLSSLRFDAAPFIIDAGGYIGTAAIALKKDFPSSLIICIEPSRENFQLLQENIDGHSGIFAIHGALVQDGGPSSVYLRESATGPWGFETGSFGDDCTEKVGTVTFGHLLSRFEQARVSICKMDIEGGEEPLLEEFQGWLHSVDALAIELHDRKRPGIQRLFEEATAHRFNLRLPGEKVLSISPSYLSKIVCA